MKKTSVLGKGSLAMGAALLALGGYASVGHAQSDILNDLTATTTPGPLPGSPYLAQDFLASAGMGGGFVSATLDLNFDAAAVAAGLPFDVYIYHSLGSGPYAPLQPNYGLLGTITPTVVGAYDYTVNLAGSFVLTAGQMYSISIDTSLTTGTVAWEHTGAAAAAAANTANSATGTFLSAYTSPDAYTWTPVSSTAFQLEVVPEPSTTAFMGFGGLALIFVQRLRRKTS